MFSFYLILYGILAILILPFLEAIISGLGENFPKFQSFARLVQILYFLCSIYLVVAGISMAIGWEELLKSNNLEKVAEGARGRKAIGAGIIMIWPYILIAIGGRAVYNFFTVYRKQEVEND